MFAETASKPRAVYAAMAAGEQVQCQGRQKEAELTLRFLLCRRNVRDDGGADLPRLGIGGAALISPSAEWGSRSTARSPSDTMPTACRLSTTGTRRMACVRMSRTACSTLSVGGTVTKE